MVTIRDVARLAGVSAASVSAVLNGGKGVSPELVKRIQKAIKVLDYHPDIVARSLRVRRTNTVGVIMPQIASPFFAEVLRGVEEEAKHRDYSILICDSATDPELERRLFHALVARRVDGILLASANPSFVPQPSSGRNVPVVFFDRLPTGCPGPAVLVNNKEGTFEATRHVISLGHRRIAIVTGPMAISSAAERADGFRVAMGAAGLPVLEGYLRCGGFGVEGGFQCVMEMLKITPPPTALLISNYEMTLGALRALRQLGIKVPDEMSLVGFDDFVMGPNKFSWATLFSPQLTTVAQPGDEIGREAIKLLMRKIETSDGASPASSETVIRLQVELLIRESTGPAPSN